MLVPSNLFDLFFPCVSVRRAPCAVRKCVKHFVWRVKLFLLSFLLMLDVAVVIHLFNLVVCWFLLTKAVSFL